MCERALLVRLATWVSVCVAFLLISVKLVAWLRTDSMSLQATLIDSVLDAMASLINFFAVRQALKPADNEHRFGHGKIEALASLLQSAFIAGSALWLLIESLKRFKDPSTIHEIHFGLGVMIFSIVMTLALIFFQRYIIYKTRSTAIKADAAHYVGDVLVNCAVIIALIGSQNSWSIYLDPLIGILISFYICFSAWNISKESIDMLIDREIPESEREKIIQLIFQDEAVKGYHDLRTRMAGHQEFIQFHLELDGSLSLKEAHTISDRVMCTIQKVFPYAEILIHEDVSMYYPI